MKSTSGCKTMFFILIICFFFIATILSVKADSESERLNRPLNILILNSYQDSEWTDSLNRGIENSLPILKNEYNVYTENLDYKRFPDEEYQKLLTEQYVYKYKDRTIDIIITTDNMATEFALKNRNNLFSNAPVIFCGVQKEKADEYKSQYSDFTGVYEDIDVEETLKTAMNMNPNLQKVYLISELTETGRITEDVMEEQIRNTAPDLQVISLSDETLDEICKDAGSLENNSIIMIGAYSVDKEGLFYGGRNLVHNIVQNSSVPVYVLYDYFFGTGAIGGKMVSGDLHGKLAGELAVRVLKGEDVNQISSVDNKNFQNKYDATVLQKFNISSELLPEDSIIVNRNRDFMERFRTIAVVVMILFILLVLFITVLLINIRRRTRAERKLERLAYYDTLTGLRNRTGFLRLVKETHEYAVAMEKRYALFYMDLDDFKEMNDTFGHSFGDEVLRQVANRFQTLCNWDIEIARLGGDEFILILQNATDENVKETIDKVIAAVGEELQINTRNIHLSSSIGIAIYPDHASDYETLLSYADIAMYMAKKEGKMRYKVFDRSWYYTLEGKVKLSEDIRTAIEKKQFLVYYQPEVDTRTGKIKYVEALIRWKHPERGMVNPMDFIPLAESTGQISQIGLYVLREILDFKSRLIEYGISDLSIAINVSVKQLTEDDFVDKFTSIVSQAGMQPSEIIIEITETLLMESIDKINDKLDLLRDNGFLIALDDFGTGYSSLNYLHRLPLQTLKIDRSFIDCIGSNEMSRALIMSIIDIAHKLNMTVVAEGVENLAQKEFLTGYGCDFMQGYYFSRPLPEKELLALLQSLHNKPQS